MKKEVYEKIISYVSDNYEEDFCFVYDKVKDDVFPYSFLDDEYKDEDEDEISYIEIPRTSSKEAYQLMISFVNDTQDANSMRQFSNALRQNRPFARFNALLKQLNLEGKFADYQREKYKVRVDEWMKNNGLEIESDIKLDFANWKNEFSNLILQRGLRYYKDNKVAYATVNDDVITAKVFNYDISIRHKNRKITKMYCSCPCGFNCKHEAAVMYYVTSEDPKKLMSSNNLNNTKIDYRRLIRNSFESIKEDNDNLLLIIKTFFESDDDNKKEFLNELLDKAIYAKFYYSATRDNIIDYLIDKAYELNDLDSLIFAYKTSSIEDYKFKITYILKEYFQNNEKIKPLISEENIIENYFTR